MPLNAAYLEGNEQQRSPRNWPSSPAPQNPFLGYRSWLAPLAALGTAFVSAVAGPNTATVFYTRTGGPFKTAAGTTILGTVFAGAVPAGNMDCPRNVVVNVTHASSVVAVTGTIFGADEYGRLISEAYTIAATGTTQTFTGKKAFARVDGLSVVSVADASADTVNVGRGSVMGLPARSALAGTGVAVKETMDGAILTTGILTAASTSAANDTQGTFLPATLQNAAHNYECWYLINDPGL